MSAALLMCSPEGFAVNYEINLWMKKQVGNVIREVALSQWQALFNTLSGMAEVQVMPGDPTWPDLVFTANAGLPVPVMKRFILSNFKHPQRQGEKPLNRAWFESNGWECVELPFGASFEGAGDALVDSRGILWLGYGFRSDVAAAALLAPQVKTPIRSLQLIDLVAQASRRKVRHLAPPPDLMNSESGDAATAKPRDSSTARNRGVGSFMTTRPPTSTALAQNNLPSAGVSSISLVPKTPSRSWREFASKASGK